MKLATLDTKKAVEIKPEIFELPFNEGLVHQVVNAYLAGKRQGSKAQKTRAEVSGGGAKPWRQKGSGRARAGTSSSPIWRSGGQTFAAKPRNYSQKVNKKMYKRAMAIILAELNRQERLVVLEKLDWNEPKTKLLANKLKELSLSNVLIINDEPNRNLELAVRNLPHVAVLTVDKVNPVSLINFEKILITQAALAKFEERLS
ncbi:MAG: 50S ribosomal protein L4 [Gammaproteobacteria bacterium]|nr:50S ribosomal protein L4 [Gammaproteobacteria bacterium]